ncbi:histone-lysine N-methyltransferase SETMAR-like isoform X1 [Convolutriloba macropyga]|uniref:histone-lysine N-methyltransferase SETMAR-like isoform X1 n=1 Tax=Convolutriloba macropyga TaxID=536237 RepID=UPI003F51E122
MLEGCEVTCSSDSKCDPEKCACMRSGLAYEGHKLSAEFLRDKRPVFECHEDCPCSLSCPSRVTQFIDHWPFLFKKNISDQVGAGLFSSSPIPEGAFVCSYDGKLIEQSEAIAKMDENDAKNQHNYVMIFTENYQHEKHGDQVLGGLCTCIDGTDFHQSFGRSINHSCDPNLIPIPVRCGWEVPRICLFAMTYIAPGHELSYSYSSGAPSQKLSTKQCFCGSKSCRKFLPSVAC